MAEGTELRGSLLIISSTPEAGWSGAALVSWHSRTGGGVRERAIRPRGGSGKGDGQEAKHP